MKIKLILILLMLGISLSACGSNRGWRVEFGASPVSTLDNHAGLKEHDSDGRKY